MSSLRVGIVGLPNAGKTTLFNALSRCGALWRTTRSPPLSPNVGVVPVPDPRLEKVADLAGCGRRVPATASFVDIAGPGRGREQGRGPRKQVPGQHPRGRRRGACGPGLRVGGVAHVTGGIDPVRDAELIETELRLADLEVLGREIAKARQAAKSGARDMRGPRGSARAPSRKLVGGEAP